jgi:GNAT superfamily N-acetyltransferase
MGTNNIEIITIDSNRQAPDLYPLREQIAANPNLLHPNVEDMLESWHNGLGAIGVNEKGEAISYARLIPLLSPLQVEALGLPEPLGHIYEMGTVFVSEAWRNQGIGQRVQREALEHMHNGGGERLIIGTTKAMGELKALGNIDIPGIQFQPAHHFEYPMVAPLTCTCDPDFGSGFKYGKECSQRISPKDVPVIVFQNGRIPRRNEVQGKGEIKCTMFTSNPATARKFDEGLREIYHTQENFVSALKVVNYYG